MNREDLLARLGNHQPADANEHVHHGRLTAVLTTLDAPFSRNTFSPGHVTASAFVVSRAGDAVLLIHHGKLHRWMQPGGHIERDDRDIEHAARREVAEETGVALAPEPAPIFDVDVHVIPAR